MRECVKTVVANCDVCNRTANKFTWPSRPKARSRAVTTPFAEVEMDYNVKAVTQEFEGYKYILIIICTVSEFCVLIPCRTRTSEELIRRYRERYLSYVYESDCFAVWVAEGMPYACGLSEVIYIWVFVWNYLVSPR